MKTRKHHLLGLALLPLVASCHFLLTDVSGEIETKKHTIDASLIEEIDIANIYLGNPDNPRKVDANFHNLTEGNPYIEVTAQSSIHNEIKVERKIEKLTISSSKSKCFNTPKITIDIYGYKFNTIGLENVSAKFDEGIYDEDILTLNTVKSSAHLTLVDSEKLYFNLESNSSVSLTATKDAADIFVNAIGGSTFTLYDCPEIFDTCNIDLESSYAFLLGAGAVYSDINCKGYCTMSASYFPIGQLTLITENSDTQLINSDGNLFQAEKSELYVFPCKDTMYAHSGSLVSKYFRLKSDDNSKIFVSNDISPVSLPDSTEATFKIGCVYLNQTQYPRYLRAEKIECSVSTIIVPKGGTKTVNSLITVLPKDCYYQTDLEYSNQDFALGPEAKPSLIHRENEGSSSLEDSTSSEESVSIEYLMSGQIEVIINSGNNSVQIKGIESGYCYLYCRHTKDNIKEKFLVKVK